MDLLKFNNNFNSSYLNNGFFKHYFSMFVKNPIIFFEAWELETFGFWAVNQEEINYYSRNITGAFPRNLNEQGFAEELQYYDLEVKNLLKNDSLREIFPSNDIFVPLGMINWIILLLITFLILRNKNEILLALTPSIGLFLTLVIASPIFYWPRYGIAEQYLLPIYFILFFILRKNTGCIDKQ